MSFRFSPSIVTNGLVLYLDAANTRSYISGSTVWSDLSRSKVDGTLVNSGVGLTFNSANGGSLTFDGTNDYINMGNTSLGIDAGSTQITLEAWIYPTAFISYRGIISRIASSGPFGGWMIYTDGDSGNRLGFAVNVSGIWSVLPNIGSLSTNLWYHLTGTYDGSSMKIYVNGLQSNSVSKPGTIQYASSLNNLVIGWNTSGPSYFPGNIAIARIYNRALSASEVLQNYNTTRSRFNV